MKTNRMKILFFIFSLSILGIISVNSNAGVTNKYCPVTTNELAEEKFSLEYKGETIYFCCNSCKKDFLADPDAYLANLSLGIKETKQEGHDHAGHDHDSEVPDTVNEIEIQSLATIENDNIESHEHSEESTHDHATDHKQTSSLLTFIGKMHPLVIHFPIALVLTALLFTGLSLFFKVAIFDTLSIYLIYIAALSAVLSVVLGLIAGSNASYPSFLLSSFEWHRILGISSSLVTLITAYVGYRRLSQKPNGGVTLYRLVLLINAILVSITGHLGATLVYGIDYFNF